MNYRSTVTKNVPPSTRLFKTTAFANAKSSRNSTRDLATDEAIFLNVLPGLQIRRLYFIFADGYLDELR